jgi:nitrite reductase/ring-hydroxylating ferredoxin subunit
MKKFSKDQIILLLQREGIVFSEFTLTHQGRYDVDDADWNYKDVPHLNVVHELAEGITTTVGDELITALIMQKVLFLKFPLSLTNYDSGPASQTYYTTWMFYVLLIETVYERLAPEQTRVVTTYSVGSPRWLRWTFPIIRWILTRNYKNLMSADVPMRLRRGELRSWGYSFKKGGEKYSFERTMSIMRSNVVPPELTNQQNTSIFRVADVLPSNGEHFLGRDDHLGVRIVRTDGILTLFPRMCPHEGASLDRYKCSGPKEPIKDGKLQCPWHGRVFGPFARVDISGGQPVSLTTENHEIKFADGILQIQHMPRVS